MKKYVTLFFLVVAAPAFAQDSLAGKFSADVFGDYSYNTVHDTSAAIANAAVGGGGRNFNAFQFRRIWFTHDNPISKKFSTRFRIDGTTGSPIVKDAFVRWKSVFSGSDLCIGLQLTPAYEISSKAWGYRALEKTIMDLHGIVSSRDLGISLRGTIDGHGALNYWVMVGNNSGTGVETDRYKRFYANVEIHPLERLLVTFYADYSMKPDINNAASAAIPKSSMNNDDMTTAAFVCYGVTDKFNVGIEAFSKITANGNAIGSPQNVIYTAKNALGVTVFGTCSVSPDLTLVSRFDIFDPNTDGNFTGDARNYFLAGLSWKVDKNVTIIPNVQYETYERSATDNRGYDPSVTGRMTFYYMFW